VVEEYAQVLLWQQLTWSYTDATPPTQSSVSAGVPIQGSNVQNTITTVDGLGRTVTQKISDGTTTYSIVGTQYDPIGRAYMTSNPYTSSAQYWTTAQFDVLGRATKTLLQDSSATTFSYATNTATVTDPAGKARKSFADGLGRMTKVFEDPSGLNYETDYSYNILDQLTGVTQGAQTRTYVYDDLGRVNKTTTPEAGTFCFGTYSGSTCQTNGYDSFGDLLYRTDARGVLTSYTYDNLNRLSTIAYTVTGTGVTATPGVTLTYDQGGSAAYALGRLTSMADGVGSETYTYNNLGEMTQLQKVIGTAIYTTGYAYNLAGELSSITYPSSRVVQQSFDTIGRLCAVGASGSTCSSGTTYASGYAYNAAFQVTGFNYGNGVAAAFGYAPDRLLLQSLAYTKGSNTLFSTNYWYKTDATNCPNGASGNNGQIQCITDNVDSGRTVSYAFDSLYRITAATTNGSSNYTKWGLTWTYDRYGNRLTQGQAYDAPPTNTVSVNAATNQINSGGYAYDANGNMTNDGNNTLVYDAENHLLSATNGGASGTYTYDGNGLRVKKASGSTTTVYIFSGSKVITEYDNGAVPSSPSREYIYSGSALLAKIDSSGTKYYHQDQLSNRVVTDSSGNTLEQLGHYPFGESWYNATNDKLLFTSYERDAESGNDYAMARYNVNRLGRFSSPDLISGSTSNPQSFDRYGYALDDPANLIDPFGMAACIFNILVTNDAGLTVKDLIKALFQTAAIFGQGTDANGNTVGVNFTFGVPPADADYTLNFTTSNFYDSSDRLGHTWSIFSYSAIYIDNIASDNDAYLGTVGDRYAGAVAAHELIQHAMLGNLFDGTNLTNVDANPNPWPVAPNNNALTADQIGALFKKCQKLHPGNGRGGGHRGPILYEVADASAGAAWSGMPSQWNGGGGGAGNGGSGEGGTITIGPVISWW
jgi:RHS repeat-associated protein